MSKPLRYNDKGSDVVRVQRELMSQGYPLPAYGSDGHLGDETWEALQRYARDHGLQWRPDVPMAVLEDLEDDSKSPEVPAVDPASVHGVKVYDLRGEQPNPPKRSRKFKLSAGGVVSRNPAMVTGITIHQTAVRYGIKDYQVQASGGDIELALARRSKEVACHVMAFIGGFIAWPNPLDWYVYHGNGFNASKLGLEIDGNYPGLIGGKVWNHASGGKETVVTDELVKAACAGIELLTREGRKMGMPIQYIHAHRQSSSKRRGDPGEELWKRVVLDFAVDKLGLIPRQDYMCGDGRPVPREWDPNGVGSY
jgi:hypothetical protein